MTLDINLTTTNPRNVDKNIIEETNNRFRKSTCAFLPFLPATQSTAAVRTYHLMTTAPVEFDAVALIIINNGAATTLDGAAIAVSESNTSKTVPVVNGTSYNAIAAADTNLGWVPVTFNGGATSTAIAIGTETAPSFLLSDFIPLSSIPRTDGGLLPLIMSRVYYNNRAHPWRNVSQPTATGVINTQMYPHEYYNVTQGVDGVSAPANLTNVYTAGGVSNLIGIFGLVYRTRKGTHTIIASGDSIQAGGSVTTTDTDKANAVIGSWVSRSYFKIMNQKDQKVPVGFVNISVGGTTPTEYYARMQTAITAGIPATVAIFAPWSPNTFPPTGRVKTAGFIARAAEFIDYAKDKRIQPILTTPTTYSAWSDSTREGVRKSVLSMDAKIIDFNKAVYDATKPTDDKWKDGTTEEGTHPSTLGHDLMETISATPIISGAVV